MPSEARIVVVTGATGGIGRALARVFADQGDRLVLTDLVPETCTALAAECGQGSLGVACDLSDPLAIARFWAWMDEQGLMPDVLLNNAGIGPSMQPTLETDPEDFAKVIDVNLIAAAQMLEHAARRMKPGSAIVTTASLAGLVPNPKRNAYGAAKAALVALTEHAATTLLSKGISVSGIAPGYVLTDMVATLSREGRIDLDAVRRRVPLGRLARPDEMASVVRFLASPEGAGCTGQTIAVDGGWSAFNMGGDACPTTHAAIRAETEALDQAEGSPRFLAGDDPWSQSIARALTGQGIAVTFGSEPASSVIVVGAPGQDQRELYRRDFWALREAVKHVLPLSGSVVYVATPESPTLIQGLRSGGVAMLLRGMAAEFGPSGVRINGVFPRDDTHQTCQSAAEMARFLASPNASYVTGAMLNAVGHN